MSKIQVNMELTKAQRQFLESKSRVVGFRAGLSSGKSRVLSLWAILEAIKGYSTLYILPTFTMIRDVAAPTIKELVEIMQIEEHVILRQSPPELEIPGRGKILFRSAEQGDRIRGINCHNLCLDECVLMPESIYAVAVARARVKKKSKEANYIRLASTPGNAEHWFSKLPMDDIYTQSTMESPFVSMEFKRDLYNYYAQFGEEFVRQELYGEVQNLHATDLLITKKDIDKSLTNIPIEDESPMVAGLDIAASLEGDSSVLVLRKGNVLLDIREWRQSDAVKLAEDIAQVLLKYDVKEVIADAPGVGRPTISIIKDNLKSTNIVISEFWGSSTGDNMAANKRTLAYVKAKEWLKTGVLDKIKHKSLIEELPNATKWKLNDKGKVILLPKELLKKELGKSPDFADAFSLSMMANDKVSNITIDAFRGYSGW